MTPRVTVLLAVHNGGNYLRDAVDSVLTQTYQDFELLLVDDASTDDAADSLPTDPRIRLLRNDRNLGQIPSLNRGLRAARGEYVARLDHDDLCLPRRLELQVDLLDRLTDVALVGGWVDVVDSNDRLWTRLRPCIDSFTDFALQVVTGRVQLVHPSVTFRRSVVLDLGGFDESLSASEDQELYRRLVLARCEARVVAETLLRYRRHEKQMTIAKSAAVWESDARSHDRFLAALAPGSPPTVTRFMLRTDRRFWHEPEQPPGWLEHFLDEASSTLRLASSERAALAGALARSATATMLSGWAGDSAPDAYRGRALGLATFSRRYGDGWSRAIASATPFLTRTALAGAYVGAVRSGVTRSLRSEALAHARRVARSSRLLRRMYARIADTRTHE